MSQRAEGGRRLRPGRGRPRRPGGRGRAPTQARLVALRVLERVARSGAYADVLLNATLARSDLAAADRAFATDLVQGTLRWRGRIDFLLGKLLDRDLDRLEPLVATALRLGAYQIVFAERVPATAAVDESVRCIRAAGVERATGLVNAILRRLSAEHAAIALPSLESDPVAHLVHALSLPEWLATRWIDAYGSEEAAALARASNRVPPLVARANRLRGSRDALLEELRPRWPDAAACRLAADGIVLGRRGNAVLDPAFLDGRLTIQDEASQLVVALLDPQPGESVLDVCAAPGGKSTAIAERVGAAGRVLALDRNPRRLDLVRRHGRRLELPNLSCAERDATRPLRDLPHAPFDRVLVDAPCSGTGTLRRNPDARWRVGAGDPARLAETQLAILRQAATAVRPGGTLVYSTCTLLREENEEVVASFLKGVADFHLAPLAGAGDEVRPALDDEGFLRCFPHRHDSDGFFAARLERRS